MDGREEIQQVPRAFEERYSYNLAIFDPVVRRVVDALGGVEDGAYRLGDEAYGCLKDLKKLWRKDDTDDDRTVARIFWRTRVLGNDLVPILLATAGKGMVEDKRAIACADLMTAMTWPIDVAEELKEIDEELDGGADYTELLFSHLNYKAALLKPGVMEALFAITLPPLAKSARERKERDGQIISVVLHLIRNLAFIKDLPSNINLSADRAEFSSLQDRLVRSLAKTNFFILLLTIASNVENDPLFNSWNTLVLEILYLCFRGVKPVSLASNQAKQPAENLRKLLAAEEKSRQDIVRKSNTRHSRFGTTIAVTLKPKPSLTTTEGSTTANASGSQFSRAAASTPMVLHRQQAISSETGDIIDLTKKSRAKKAKKEDELGREDDLSLEARLVLQELATEIMRSCFNPFLASLLKDIKSERPKITEKDNLRLLYLTKWLQEFFLASRSKHGPARWGYGLVAEVIERGWIVWVLKRMREASEEKPKQWNELQAGIECLTQLLLLIDDMSSNKIEEPALREASELLQQQLIYNGEVLDIAFESLRLYKDGTQSLAYLDSAIHLAYALLKMLERWGKSRGEGVYVRKKKAKKRKGDDSVEGGVPDVEEIEVEQDDEVVHETMFTFEAFEMKFANSEITNTLLAYLARYKTFSSSENMKRVVSLLHRQAVKAKAEGLFFKVSTLELFKTILADQKSFPREQPYKDLISLIKFILRQFFKAMDEDSFLLVEAFFPKNRGHWKQFSSWEPEKSSRRENSPESANRPQEVHVKRGYSWSQQLGITISALIEAGNLSLVTWVQDILGLVIGLKQKIIDETDAKPVPTNIDDDDDDEEIAPIPSGPSTEALAKFTDFVIPYDGEGQEEAAAKNARLRLLFRLCKFHSQEEDGQDYERVEWYIPAAILPSDLQSTLNVITQYLSEPFDLEGKKTSDLIKKTTRRRRKRRRTPSPAGDSSTSDSDADRNERKRKAKKKKEKEQYKSAVLIESDSDGGYGDIDAFLEKERLLREKMAKRAMDSGKLVGTMKSTGTKKRRRKGLGAKVDKNENSSKGEDGDRGSRSENEESLPGEKKVSPVPERPRPRPRPRPKPRLKKKALPEVTSDGGVSSPPANPPQSELDIEPIDEPGAVRRKGRLVVSDEEDED